MDIHNHNNPVNSFPGPHVQNIYVNPKNNDGKCQIPATLLMANHGNVNYFIPPANNKQSIGKNSYFLQLFY